MARTLRPARPASTAALPRYDRRLLQALCREHRDHRKVVEYAHDHGVVVEAELGTLAGIEDDVKVAAHAASYTRPEEVEEFVTKTGCDSLAIAIGTSHGAYKSPLTSAPGNEKGILVPPSAAVRRAGGGLQAPARLPHRAARLFHRPPGDYVKMINDNGGKMPDAVGIPEGAAASRCRAVRLQDQHRLRSASGHDRPPSAPSSTSIPTSLTPAST